MPELGSLIRNAQIDAAVPDRTARGTDASSPANRRAPDVAGDRLRRATIATVGLTVVWLALPAAAAFAQQPCTNPIALFESVKNGVQVTPASTAPARRAAQRASICEGDRIQVADNSRAVILILATNTPIAIDQNSEFIVTAAPARGSTVMNLLRGALLYISRVRRSVEIRTPFVNASIEGTEFVVRVDADRTLIRVFEGAVRAANALGNVLVAAGQEAVALQGQAPQLQVVVRPRDAVQWALYYEPVLPAGSFDQLPQITDAAGAPLLVQRAALLLAAGQLHEAQADLDAALRRDPSNGDIYVLRTVVAVALNDKQGALQNGRAAVARSSESAAALIALSYGQQANLQLEAARETVQQAVTLHPDDGSAWARLAELRLMLDDVGGAAEAAGKATMLAPQLGRAHLASGFTALAKLELSAAERSFERAVELEPDNPIARLGRGLTRIRRGHLPDGRADLELAVAFNPNDPIVRSYLGKAYFDERRDALSAQEFAAARALDPLDPTPLFYDAIREQAANQPVAALDDLQESVRLNGNRAVYRSRFLLDQDLAARGASLGQIYRDLGFEQLALVQGWRSIEADPADHSGHRFLAETYSTLPRHAVARVSEMLQAQLLQPLTLTPVSPRLAQTDLFFLEGAGPDAPAYNEFNALFNRNRLAVQASGVAGNEDVLGDEITVAGIWNRLSFSAGQFHYGSNGFRENNDQRRDIGNVFVQGSLSPVTMVQAEYREEQHRFGDLFVNFDPTDFLADQRSELDGSTLRVGARHAFNPRSTLVGSAYWRDRDDHFVESDEAFGVTTHVDSTRTSNGYTAEVRHFLTLDRLRLTSGGGHFKSSRNETTALQAELEGDPLIDETTMSSDHPQQTNAYAYSFVDLGRNLTVTVGASVDFFERQFFERNQFNPKIGVAWHVTPATTIRAAAFRALHRAAVSDQTIEPTEVAGFSQQFADLEGTESRRYGLAVDQKFGARFYAGGEYAFRDLRVPLEKEDFDGTITVKRFTRTERFGRAYMYATWTESVAASAGYMYERFGGDPEASLFERVAAVTTHRVPFDIRYFATSGVAARFGAEYLHQRGTFGSGPGKDQFWVLDASVGYRLPRRYGRLTFDVANLLDEHFNYQDTDPSNPVVRSGRLAVLRFTVGL